jgi:hypothetical protein
MATLPRQKKQRRSAPDAAPAGAAALDDALALNAAASSSSHAAANGHMHAAAGPSHQLHYDPEQPPQLPPGALAYNPADAPMLPRRPYNTRVPASVREVIGGRVSAALRCGPRCVTWICASPPCQGLERDARRLRAGRVE